MNSVEYSTPRDYLLNSGYSSLRVPAVVVLSDLEKAILGSIISSSAIGKDGTRHKRSSSHENLRELVFEYYKMFYPHIVQTFIRKTKEYLQELRQKTPRTFRPTITTLISYLKELEEKPVDQINYKDFEPDKLVYVSVSPTPFRTYVNNIITNLIILGVLAKNSNLGRRYVTINPKLEFRLPSDEK